MCLREREVWFKVRCVVYRFKVGVGISLIRPVMLSLSSRRGVICKNPKILLGSEHVGAWTPNLTLECCAVVHVKNNPKNQIVWTPITIKCSAGTHQIVFCFGNIGVIMTQILLIYVEGSAVVILHLLILALVLTNQCQVIQLLGHIWVLWAQDLDTNTDTQLTKNNQQKYQDSICKAVRDNSESCC